MRCRIASLRSQKKCLFTIHFVIGDQGASPRCGYDLVPVEGEASELAEQTRGSGIIARFGGEEFAFVGLVSDGVEPATCLEDIRQRIADIGLVLDGEPVSITASIGATETLGDDLDAMLAIADGAVYQAKEQGRDRVVMTAVAQPRL